MDYSPQLCKLTHTKIDGQISVVNNSGAGDGALATCSQETQRQKNHHGELSTKIHEVSMVEQYSNSNLNANELSVQTKKQTGEMHYGKRQSQIDGIIQGKKNHNYGSNELNEISNDENSQTSSKFSFGVKNIVPVGTNGNQTKQGMGTSALLQQLQQGNADTVTLPLNQE